jgi:hypothetical protein
MLLSIVVAITFSFITFTAVADTGDDPYSVLETFTSVAAGKLNSSACPLVGTIDFDGFSAKLPFFREAWLNKDYSIDFYNQRRKQIFVYTISKRFAEVITEAFYRDKNSSDCNFSTRAKYLDKFGQPKEIPVMSWRFTGEQNAKIDWDKIDLRDFTELALDFKILPEASAWMADEPGLDPHPAQSPTSACDTQMFMANAMFIRATTYCKKDYMDSDAGYYALKKAKECGISEEASNKMFMAGAKRLDDISRKQGQVAVCRFVESIEQQVLRAVRN